MKFTDTKTYRSLQTEYPLKCVDRMEEFFRGYDILYEYFFRCCKDGCDYYEDDGCTWSGICPEDIVFLLGYCQNGGSETGLAKKTQCEGYCEACSISEEFNRKIIPTEQMIKHLRLRFFHEKKNFYKKAWKVLEGVQDKRIFIGRKLGLRRKQSLR